MLGCMDAELRIDTADTETISRGWSSGGPATAGCDPQMLEFMSNAPDFYFEERRRS